MRKSLVGLWFVLQICSLWSADLVQAQQTAVATSTSTVTESVTGNLITSPLTPTVPATGPEGFSGGGSVGYNSSTNTYYFGYTQQTIAKTIAINNALQGSGVQVGGVEYGMSYLNGGNTYGSLGMNVNVTSNTGALLNSYSHTFNTQNSNWQQFDQTQRFTNPYDIANLGNVSMSITGRDSRFWAGYYGPQVKDPYLRLTYTAETPVVTTPQFWDDTYVQVPLQFGFPFYGRTFTTSFMHSNGVVSFLDPAVPIPDVGYNPAQWAYCCGDRPTTTRPEFQYMIAPLWTDLYPDSVSTFRTEGTSQYQKYFWNNLGEISNTNNRNTFSLELRPTGYIGVNYTQINMNQTAWIGTVGNPAYGEINEVFYGSPGLNNTTINNWSMPNTPIGDVCLVNPLSSPTCAGYTNAMCAINPLYATSCAGYAQAYYTQQCSSNPLYDVNCPGYASAYLDYQCSVNPLYSTTCRGYEQAYHDQQCSINPLYATDCTGYTTAYHDQQCSINPLYATDCTGYAQAYLDQQCSINPLYSTTCTGYASAYKAQQCSLNALYATDCPGYQQAYYTQQCTADPLYDKGCTGYAEAYALKYVVVTTPVTSPTTTSPSTPTQSAPSVESSGEIKVAVVADSNVNNVITTTATSASPAQAATATVPLVQTTTTTPTAAVVEAKVEAKADAKPEEKKDASSSSVSSTSTAQGSSTENKPAAPTARQELQAKREAAAKAKAVEEGKNLANKMGDAANMEQQKQVQNVVIQAMGFTPGFDAYGKALVPDGVGYKPFTVYKGQVNVDNKRLGRGLYGPSDRLHDALVGSQYGN